MKKNKPLNELLKDTCFNCGNNDCFNSDVGRIEITCFNCLNKNYGYCSILENCDDNYGKWIPHIKCEKFILKENFVEDNDSEDDIIIIEDNGGKTWEIKDEHFKIFKKYSKEFIKMFNLKDWRVYYGMFEDDSCLAFCTRTPIDRTANIFLCNDWDIEPNENNIREMALHEVLHIFLSDFAEKARIRFINEDELDKIEHSLIIVLCNAMKELLKKEK